MTFPPVILAHDPRPQTIKQIAARLRKMHKVWPTLSPEQQEQYAGLRADLEVAAEAYECWQRQEPEQLGF